MSEYVIQKKVKCERCGGTEIIYTGLSLDPETCPECEGGYIYEEVPLIDALRELEQRTYKVTDLGGYEYIDRPLAGARFPEEL